MDHFSCALQKGLLLLQGQLYIFTRHICFKTDQIRAASRGLNSTNRPISIAAYHASRPHSVAKITTRKSYIAIPMADVTMLRKKKTAKMFPNAIKLQCKDDSEWIFTSFIFRDEAFNLLQASSRLCIFLFWNVSFHLPRLSLTSNVRCVEAFRPQPFRCRNTLVTRRSRPSKWKAKIYPRLNHQASTQCLRDTSVLTRLQFQATTHPTECARSNLLPAL